MGTKLPFGRRHEYHSLYDYRLLASIFLARRVDLNPAGGLVPVACHGAYSTFSTYEWETFSTIELELSYLLPSMLFSLSSWASCCVGGSVIAERL